MCVHMASSDPGTVKAFLKRLIFMFLVIHFHSVVFTFIGISKYALNNLQSAHSVLTTHKI